jgi:hypothetical protein
MVKAKANAITKLTEDIHNQVTEVYELLMDEENDAASKKIEETVTSLRNLKQDTNIKDEI